MDSLILNVGTKLFLRPMRKTEEKTFSDVVDLDEKHYSGRPTVWTLPFSSTRRLYDKQ